MPKDEPTELSILLEIVKIIGVRQQAGGSRPFDSSLLIEAIRNLPPGTTVKSLLDLSNSHKETIMGDRYEVGQAGAVGPQSVAVGQTFNQIWDKTTSNVDFQQLAEELRRVREAARVSSNGSPEEDLALAELAKAEIAARQNDGPKMMSHLEHAGKWALGIATQLGVPIAVEILKSVIQS